MRTVAVVQARVSSTRLPKKVLAPIGSLTAITLLVKRLKRSSTIDEIVVAVADEPGSEELLGALVDSGIRYTVGSKDNVLDRVLAASRDLRADIVVRVTGDCPFIDPDIVDKVVQLRLDHGLDYASNVDPPSFPDGMDVEVLTMSTLESAAVLATGAYDQEHVTSVIRSSGQFRTGNLSSEEDFSGIRLTLDEAVDLMVLRAVSDALEGRDDFALDELTGLWKDRPEIFSGNIAITRNEGAAVGTGQKLWKHAKQVIPGGNMLLSKRSEMFLPDQWPSYFSKARGCEVWDLDDKHYFDMSSMGVGTNSLGYGNDTVDDAVVRTVRSGNMSTLNCPEEVALADRLLGLNPWAGMVRLARTGGEANAIAIRIARASTGKDKIAICGYHGWHDWYLSANLSDDANLDGHLLPGLAPTGVPRNLTGTVLPFEYNDLEQLKEILSSGDVAAIKMEVVRSLEPTEDFLGKVRKLASDNGVVLIFDECTSGFRETFGGLHQKYGVQPDLAVFGKALGNGYPITAVVGRSEVMQAAQTSFISSTFWTDRIGPTAALATLDEMERLKSWGLITSIGNKVRAGWQALSHEYDLRINLSGLPALSTFSFDSPMAMEFKTFLTQHMLERGYLASTIFYACTEHSDEVIDSYLLELRSVFELLANLSQPSEVKSFLKGPVSHSGFRRIN
jgi:glutamate-1-semialdehyde 2,1-aminomutase